MLLIYMNKLPQIVVLSNDAGATEYLAHMILNEYVNANWNIFVMKNSPAEKIFNSLDIRLTLFSSFDKLSKSILSIDADIIIYGTGWQVDFSKYVQDFSLKYKIKSVALIDHWVNYKERFKENSIPNNIIVMDNLAYQMAEENFSPKTKIFQLENFFFKKIKTSFNLIKNKSFDSILFISEPTSVIAKNNLGDENAYGFTEYTTLKDILDLFDDVIVRLHPSDEKNKYDEIIKNYSNKKITIVYPYDEELILSLSKSKLTIGFDGMALYLSYLLGIDTISYMPNSNRALTIPIPKSYLIKDLLKVDNIDFSHKNNVSLDLNKISFHTMIETVMNRGVNV